mmetsp:Transcript_2426/g.5525  ORF Transcript_2426/g.5525 Transcript_2426/m.5525 type:complete len:340 (-) Transcript_2426:70-1089(-)
MGIGTGMAVAMTAWALAASASASASATSCRPHPPPSPPSSVASGPRPSSSLRALGAALAAVRVRGGARSKRKAPPKRKARKANVYDCPACREPGSVSISMKRSRNLGAATCNYCGEQYERSIGALTAPCELWAEWAVRSQRVQDRQWEAVEKRVKEGGRAAIGDLSGYDDREESRATYERLKSAVEGLRLWRVVGKAGVALRTGPNLTLRADRHEKPRVNVTYLPFGAQVVGIQKDPAWIQLTAEQFKEKWAPIHIFNRKQLEEVQIHEMMPADGAGDSEDEYFQRMSAHDMAKGGVLNEGRDIKYSLDDFLVQSDEAEEVCHRPGADEDDGSGVGDDV